MSYLENVISTGETWTIEKHNLDAKYTKSENERLIKTKRHHQLAKKLLPRLIKMAIICVSYAIYRYEIFISACNVFSNLQSNPGILKSCQHVRYP